MSFTSPSYCQRKPFPLPNSFLYFQYIGHEVISFHIPSLMTPHKKRVQILSLHLYHYFFLEVQSLNKFHGIFNSWFLIMFIFSWPQHYLNICFSMCLIWLCCFRLSSKYMVLYCNKPIPSTILFICSLLLSAWGQCILRTLFMFQFHISIHD